MVIAREGGDTVYGLGGDDELSGNGGDDVLEGGAGADRLDGGLGADRMVGGADNDTYVVDDAGDVVVEQAGGGYDRVLASLSWTLGAELERLSLAGTADLIGTGNSLANRIDGNAGSNILNGREGNDALVGGAGNDTLVGGDGNDALVGGAGNDTLVGGDGNDRLNGGLGADSMVGGTGNDAYTIDNAGDVVLELAGGGTADALTTIFSTTLSGSLAEVENLTLSGSAALSATGNAYANSITGNIGDNTLAGGDGNDRLNGGLGADSLAGGTGNDALDGGLGQDTLTGGAGNDSFSFATLTGSALATPDLITDFTPGADRVSVSAIDTDAVLAGNQAFAWIGGAAFAGAGVAQARFFNNGVDTFAAFDLGDGGDAELLIQFNGVLALSASNFVL